MLTRTLVTAEVSVERIYKDKETGEIKKDCFDEKLPNCKTRDKAEILIEKQYKGDILSILDIKFKQERRTMTEEQFLLNSEVKSEKIVTEAELQEMKKGRLTGKNRGVKKYGRNQRNEQRVYKGREVSYDRSPKY